MLPIQAIGTISTPWQKPENMPIQPTGAGPAEGCIELLPEYTDGLKDLDGFSHIILLYQLHKIEKYMLSVTPFMDTKARGVFSTRAPMRPNAIGLSTVELLRIDGNRIYIKGVDMLDGSPLLDIKPFFEHFDNRFDTRKGWLEGKDHAKIKETRSDKRFAKKQ